MAERMCKFAIKLSLITPNIPIYPPISLIIPDYPSNIHIYPPITIIIPNYPPNITIYPPITIIIPDYPRTSLFILQLAQLSPK
jgi:hypothetical protein